MNTDPHVNAYRQQLIDALRRQATHGQDEAPETIQILVNHVSVGLLAWEPHPQTFSFTGTQATHSVQLRSPDGSLLGALCLDGNAWETLTVLVAGGTVTLSVANGPGTSQVRVRTQPTPNESRRTGVSHLESPATVRHDAPRLRSVSSRLAIAAQIVLVGSVLFLVNDRLSGLPDTGVQQSSTQMVLQLEHSQHLLAQHDTALNTLRTDLEETTGFLRAQRKRMLDVQTQLSRSTESSLALQSQLLQVRQDQNHEAQALAHQMASEVKPALEAMHSQQQLIAQDLETLSTTRKSVQQDIARLDSHAKDLRQTLSEQQTLLASVAASANSAAPIAKKTGDAVTSPPSSPPLLAELQKETTPAQFTFWVSFQDGTPEKNIEELIQEVHGKKGSTNTGWYAVEVSLGGTQQPDAFADSLRKAKIVKAVTTTLNTASAK